jgi:tetratricopeptide (TPR) repeat protein
MGYTSFSGLNLREFDIAGSYLGGATLDGTDLAGGNLRGTVLQHGSLVGANLTGATATGADFGYARLTRASLVGADLSNADLGWSSLDSADLTRASLDGANFSGARIDGAQFLETTWWLAVGWTADQRRLLARWPPASYATTGTYREQLNRLDKQVDAAETGADSAAALNERSWYRAVRGAELQKAVADAKQSLELVPGDIHALDTRGYVLLQLGKRYAALADFSLSVTREPDFSRDHSPGERLYHWGLALEYIGAAKVADSVFRKSDSLGYCPTYEEVLTPRLGPNTRASSCPLGSPSRRRVVNAWRTAPLPLRRP